MADPHMAGARHHICVHVPCSRCSWAPMATMATPIASATRRSADDRDANDAGRANHAAGGLRAMLARAGSVSVSKPIGRASAATAKATTATGRASCPGDAVLQRERVAARPRTTAMARAAGTSIASSVASEQRAVASRTSAEPRGTSGASDAWALSRSSAQVAGESARTCPNHGVAASGHAAGWWVSNIHSAASSRTASSANGHRGGARR